MTSVAGRQRPVDDRGRGGRAKGNATRLVLRAVLASLVTSLVIVAGLPATSAMAGSHQTLWWNEDGSSFTRFGANASVTIYQGTATAGTCDGFFPATDIYVVSTQSLSDGQRLTDVSNSQGVPNTVFLASGGLFIDETIGFTAPSGPLGVGRYGVVYDECQDAKFDAGVDKLFYPAFDVVIPADIPPINPAIAALKGNAQAEADSWQVLVDAVEAIELLMELKGWYECLSGGLGGCALSYLSDKMQDYLKDAVMDGLGLTDPQEAAKQVVLSHIKHYGGIAADPPDPDFRRLSPLGPAGQLRPETGDPVETAIVGLGNTAASDGALLEALLRSLERYQGADAAGDGEWALIHARAVQSIAVLLRDRLPATTAAVSALGDALSTDGRDFDASASQAEPIRSRIASSGFDADEDRLLRHHALPQDQVDALRADIAAVSHAGFAEATTHDAVNRVVSENGALGSTLGTLASDMQGIIDHLKGQAGVADRTPRADAGGPYSGPEGSALRLDGSRSTDADGSVTSWQWDLDRDGQFDDATGATPTATFPSAFDGTIGLEVTDNTGRKGVGYARATVADANRPPSISSAAPAGAGAEVLVGAGLGFSVSSADPDGDATSVRWSVDFQPVATGANFDYRPSASQLGMHTVRAEVSDGVPAGGTVIREWAVSVLMPDADGDGWRANLDCDDTDAQVYPGRTEVVGNGKDDDCNRATGDAGTPPTAAFTFAPDPAPVGEPVTFTDSSTDPDGAVVAWDWDLGDGTRSSERHPVHAYAAPASYTVTLTVRDEQGDLTTASKTLRVGARPTAAFTVEPDPPVAGEGARFTDTSTDADDTVASRAWDFGDGATSSDPSPLHTYAVPGTYTVTLKVTDSTGFAAEIRRDLVVRGRPTADFSVGGGLNVARLEDGARVVSASSVASSSSSHRPENAIDASTSTAWFTASGQNRNQRLAVSLVPGGPHVVDRVVVRGSGATTGPKEFEVRVSNAGTEPTAFTTVLTATLPMDANAHDFGIPAMEARHVELVVKSNWGGSQVAVPLLQLWERQREGGVVSLGDGPRASAVAASSSATGNGPERAIDDDPASFWRSGSGQRTNQWMKVRLGGERLYTVDRVGLKAGGTTGPRNFEIRLSETSADDAAFTTVFTGVASNATAVQQFSFAPRQARYVQLFVKDNHGNTCCVDVAQLTVLTPEGTNAARGEGVGAFVVGSSGGTTPENAIDLSTTSAWTTAGGQTTNQRLDVLLVPGGPHRVDRVRLLAPNSNEAPRDFEVAVSTTTAAPGSFTTVLAAKLPRDGLEHWFKFQPTDATFVQLRLLDNHGGTVIRLNDFRAYSVSQGGAALGFDDRSTDPEDRLAAWSWDFGDGTTSTERHPTHVYTVPGTYTVTLTVTDADGLTDTVSHSYNVLMPPTADFDWTPITPTEGQQTTFRDRSSDPDGDIVAWRWRFPHLNDQTTATVSTSFPDNGAWDVSLTATDSQLLDSAVTKTVTVANAPPFAGLPDTALLWGIPWVPAFAASDPGVTDRSSLQCAFDYGDGARQEGLCSQLRPSHPYAAPGTYRATLTVTDKDGASATDGGTVTVRKRDTFVNAFVVPGSAAGGKVDVVARVWDRVDFETPVVGRAITLALGTDSVTVTTGATGAVSARLSLPAAGGTLQATFAGDTHYNPSADSDAVAANERRPPGDIVFMIDESGSMSGYQAAVRRNINDIANRLGASVDFQMGLVGFGAGAAHQDEAIGLGHIHLPVTDTISAISAALAELTIDGGFEPGYHAITTAMGDAMGYRPNAGLCAVMVADESANQGSTTQAQALAALQGRGGVLMSIVDPGAGQGYVQLSQKTGGQTFDIARFRDDPEPVLRALVDTCVAEIVQRPDLTVAIDDGAATARAGQQLSYTVTVTNASQRDATGVALSVALPAEVAFAGASDGGGPSAGGASWPAFSLAAGASVTRSVTVNVARPLPPVTGSITVTASVTDDGSGGPDITPANNTASDTDAIDPAEPPVAEDQSLTTDEDTPVSVSLRATDPEGETLAYSVLEGPQHGTLDGSAPDLTYRPAADFHGQDRFTFGARAGDRDSNTATVTITVRPVNDPPTARDDEFTVDEDDGLLSVPPGVLGNDSDIDGDGLTASPASGPAHGTLTLNPDGSFSYVPEPDFAGADRFTYTAGDGQGGTATATVTIAVRPVNDPPVVSLLPGGPVDEGGDPVELRAVASDVDGDRLTYAWTADVGVIEPLGTSARYAHAEGPATARVQVTVSDGQVSSSAETAVEVRNVAPDVEAGPDQRVTEGSVVALAPATFRDPGRLDTHTAVVDWGDGSAPEPVAVDAGKVASSHRYDDNGVYHVVVTVTDDDGGVGSDMLAVTVANLPPVVDAGPDLTQHWGLPVRLEGTVSDPSGADTRAGLDPRWDLGDGSPQVSGNPVTHVYDNPAAYRAVLTATDKDGGVGSDSAGVTITKRPLAVTYTGSTTAPFGFATLSARVSDPVDPATARLAGLEVRFEAGGTVFTAAVGGDGTAVVKDPVLLPVGSHEVITRVVEGSHYLEALARVTVVVANSAGKVTGGALRAPSGGNAGFVVQSDGAAASGELQYRDSRLRYHAHELTALGISPDARTAWFSGVDKDGTPFVAYVEDRGEPGRDDAFRLTIDGVSRTGDGGLSGGNIQIHRR